VYRYIKTNARASLRLRIAIEKMKKILSANPEAPLAIECIMDEVDVKSSMTREKMEELSQGLMVGQCKLTLTPKP
jgi:heat shock protein 4